MLLRGYLDNPATDVFGEIECENEHKKASIESPSL